LLTDFLIICYALFLKEKIKMKNTNKTYIAWSIRIIVSILFILSAIAKLYPSPLMGISSFETKYLGAIGIDGGFEKVVSRLLIGFEFTLGIFLLLPFYVKKLVVPATILLLGAFSLHLGFQVLGGDSSNCGCFGELIPMSPLEALVKNILSIGLLIMLITMFKDEIREKMNIHPVLYGGLSIGLIMFISLPQGSSNVSGASIQSGESIYSQYFPDIEKGNKLVCFFSPTCEHCKATGKELYELAQKYPGLMPEVKILFMDESDNGSKSEIESFFKFVGHTSDYKVLSIEDFIPIFWNEKNFPGVRYSSSGEERLFFDGTEDNEFDAEKLLNDLRREN
jgi:uncharacterized membrane protein YphA (DoxX/SURF4 family)